jgi:hypothetical protein
MAMRSGRIGAAHLAAMAVVAGAPATAQTEATRPDMVVPDCAFGEPARVIVSLKEVPDIASEFDRLGLAIADVGEPFVPYDVVDSSKDLPPRQFLRAYAFKDRTIAWYYHGGFGTHVHVLELREMADGTPGAPSEPVLRVTGAQLSGPPCRATQALLDGVRESGDW